MAGEPHVSYNTVVDIQNEIASANDFTNHVLDKLNDYVIQLRPSHWRKPSSPLCEAARGANAPDAEHSTTTP
eukprot:8987800-Pyramimonas_sp.AAC.1